MRRGNLLDGQTSKGKGEELFTELVRSNAVRIERIVSHGHCSRDDYWYDQAESEYVLLVSGAAELEIENTGRVRLEAGDWLDIPAHVRHRVTWTAADVDTVWLAVFYR